MRLTELFKAKERADVERLWDESERLARFCTGSDAGLDENAAIELICSAARNVVGADGACVILREGELVHNAREDSIAPLWAGLKFSIKACISGWSIVHKEPLVIPDIYSDARVPIECYKSTYVKSLMMMPIEPRNPIGAVGVYWARTHKATARELGLLTKLANVAAITLAYTRLLGHTERVRASRAELP